MLSWIEGKTKSARKLDASEVAFRARLAANHLKSAQRPDGWFSYEYDFVRGRVLKTDNNVRQAGAGFALGEYLNWSGDAEIRVATERTLLAMAGASRRLRDGMVVARAGDLSLAQSGATALSLLTELNYYEATGDTQFENLRDSWLLGLSELQLEAGGFRKNPSTDQESPYFNGEIWLAISHYDRLFPEKSLPERLLKGADEHMMGRYSIEPDIGFIHWGLMAASVRHVRTGNGQFLDFLSDLAMRTVVEVRPGVNPNSNSAYLVEGLASAAAALKRAGRGRGTLVEVLVSRCEQELNKCFELQIMPGQTQLTLGSNRLLIDPQIARMAGSFLNGRFKHRTRIDFTQHCVCALMKYQSISGVADPGGSDVNGHPNLQVVKRSNNAGGHANGPVRTASSGHFL